MPINPHIFREYDIRGHAERDLSDETAYAIGRALGTHYRREEQQRIAIGRDCRLSSERLHRALSKGLLEAGIELVDIGIGPTPLLYFAVFHLDLDGGVQITGSHNPPEDNGFKMMSGKRALFGAEIRALREMIAQTDFEQHPGGVRNEVDVKPAYVDYMKENLQLAHKDLRFAIDAGNGAGGPLALSTMQALGLKPVALLCEMDGRFPVHHPDPSEEENLELLRNTIADQKLQLGIAFDGDADRIGLLDQHGEVIWGDKLMILLSREILKRNPGAAIIGEVKCSQTLYDDISKHGGRGILWKTGHSLIKAKMKEEGALLAGEMSGHIFFADRYFGFDDALYAALRVLEIVAESGKALHELLADVPQTYSTPEIRVECSDAKKFDIVDRVTTCFRDTNEVIDVDGARILFDGGWGLVRASNTQPVLVMRFEATSPERLEEIRKQVESVVQDESA